MTISERPFGQFTRDEYSTAQWMRSCLVDKGVGDPDSKERYTLAVREPDGTLSRAAVHAAAGAYGLDMVRGLTVEAKQDTARRLIALYRELGEQPPQDLLATAEVRDTMDPPMAITEPQYRSFTPDLQVMPSNRGGDGRTVYGIAVPYDAPTRIHDNLVEQFARGAFNHQLHKPRAIKFSREHFRLGGEVIGVATELRDDAAGLYGEFRVSRTPEGDKTLALVEDGALDQLSVMFRERKNRRLAGGITERVKADLAEVAVVMEGAYGDLAKAAGVRSAQVPAAAEDLSLRAAAEEFLPGGRLAGALPELPDHDLAVRAIRLGIPF